MYITEVRLRRLVRSMLKKEDRSISESELRILKSLIREVYIKENTYIIEEGWKTNLLLYGMALSSFIKPYNEVCADTIKKNTLHPAKAYVSAPANKFIPVDLEGNEFKETDFLVREGEELIEMRGYQTIEGKLCLNNYILPDNWKDYNENEIKSLKFNINVYKTKLAEDGLKDAKESFKSIGGENINLNINLSNPEEVHKKEDKNLVIRQEIVERFNYFYNDLLESQDDDDEIEYKALTINDVLKHIIKNKNGEKTQVANRSNINSITRYLTKIHALSTSAAFEAASLGKHRISSDIIAAANNPNNFGKSFNYILNNSNNN